jgi:biotin carboxyl carrier protein
LKYFITIGERVHEVDLVRRLGELIVTVNGEPMDLKYSEADRHGQVTLQHDDRSFGASIEGSDSEVSITLAGHSYQMQIEDEREHAAHVAERAASKGGGTLKAVMPGVVVETLVAVGDEVGEGQPLLILEAMKMQNEILASGPGIVARFHVEPGQAVAAGEKLVDLKGLE